MKIELRYELGDVKLIVFVVVDDNMGMMFNNRRQSSDKVLRDYILRETKGSTLWMNGYTQKQFTMPLVDNISVDENFLDKAQENDFCFVENLSIAEYQEKIEKIILFKWNRVYPADTYFDIPLSESGWNLISVLEFEGNSHKQITREEWIK